MKDDGQVGAVGRLGGAACMGVCCALPMLVLLGVVSAGAALVGGVAVGATLAVGGFAWTLASGRTPPIPEAWARGLAGVGLVAAAAGLWALRTGPMAAGRALVAAGVAAIACAALAVAPRGRARA